MNKLPLVFLGILLVFGSAWLGLVSWTANNLSNLQPVPDEATANQAAAAVADARFADRLSLAELQRALGTDKLAPEAAEPPAPAPIADANSNGNQS